MTFAYDLENDAGEVLKTYTVEVTFTDEDDGFTSGRPERCRPASGGEIEDLVVYLGNKDVTRFIADDVYFQIRDYAMRMRR